jgi:hypothetical protein
VIKTNLYYDAESEQHKKKEICAVPNQYFYPKENIILLQLAKPIGSRQVMVVCCE